MIPTNTATTIAKTINVGMFIRTPPFDFISIRICSFSEAYRA